MTGSRSAERPAGRPRTGAHRAPPGRRRSPRVLGSLAMVIVAGLVATSVLVNRGGDEPPGDPGDPRDSSASAAPFADAADDILAWVDVELPADTRVTVPSDLRPALLRAGGDEARFLAAPAAGALRLVVGEPPSGPAVLAVFGDAPALTLVDPAPGTPTDDELGRRQRLADALLANPTTGAAGRAADVLRSAEVDARLLGLVAVLVTRLGAGISDFPVARSEPWASAPARRVLLDRVADGPLVPDSRTTTEVLTFLDAQLPPFAPDTVEVTDQGIVVAFDYVSAPDALVTAATQ